MRTAVAFVMLIAGGFISCSQASDWGHWRGPLGNGSAIEGHPPTEWSLSKNVKWKIEVPGNGSSSPVIWHDQVFITTAV
ncbi:MAG: hypothetical protein DWI02_00490, partial [Planctomycetota bacterium]